MTPRMQRFLKPKTARTEKSDEAHSPEKAPKSLHEIFEKMGKTTWLQQNHPMLLAHFNLINTTLNPEKPLAKGVACVALKGTTFPDKRPLCLEIAKKLKNLESAGEILLLPEPNNPHDQYALAAVDKETGDKIGYIPKAKELNKTYIEAIEKNRLCGAHIVSSKINDFQGSPSAILTLCTGWL